MIIEIQDITKITNDITNDRNNKSPNVIRDENNRLIVFYSKTLNTGRLSDSRPSFVNGSLVLSIPAGNGELYDTPVNWIDTDLTLPPSSYCAILCDAAGTLSYSVSPDAELGGMVIEEVKDKIIICMVNTGSSTITYVEETEKYGTYIYAQKQTLDNEWTGVEYRLNAGESPFAVFNPANNKIYLTYNRDNSTWTRIIDDTNQLTWEYIPNTLQQDATITPDEDFSRTQKSQYSSGKAKGKSVSINKLWNVASPRFGLGYQSDYSNVIPNKYNKDYVIAPIIYPDESSVIINKHPESVTVSNSSEVQLECKASWYSTAKVGETINIDELTWSYINGSSGFSSTSNAMAFNVSSYITTLESSTVQYNNESIGLSYDVAFSNLNGPNQDVYITVAGETGDSFRVYYHTNSDAFAIARTGHDEIIYNSTENNFNVTLLYDADAQTLEYTITTASNTFTDVVPFTPSFGSTLHLIAQSAFCTCDLTNITFEKIAPPVEELIPDITYQWYKNDILLSGEINDTLTLTPVDAIESYYCKVNETIQSNPAVVTMYNLDYFIFIPWVFGSWNNYIYSDIIAHIYDNNNNVVDSFTVDTTVFNGERYIPFTVDAPAGVYTIGLQIDKHGLDNTVYYTPENERVSFYLTRGESTYFEEDNKLFIQEPKWSPSSAASKINTTIAYENVQDYLPNMVDNTTMTSSSKQITTQITYENVQTYGATPEDNSNITSSAGKLKVIKTYEV